jgi:hypothetical protein
MNIFKQHKLNNILHYKIFYIIKKIIQGRSNSLKISVILLIKMLNDFDMINYLIDLF